MMLALHSARWRHPPRPCGEAVVAGDATVGGAEEGAGGKCRPWRSRLGSACGELPRSAAGKITATRPQDRDTPLVFHRHPSHSLPSARSHRK